MSDTEDTIKELEELRRLFVLQSETGLLTAPAACGSFRVKLEQPCETSDELLHDLLEVILEPDYVPSDLSVKLLDDCEFRYDRLNKRVVDRQNSRLMAEGYEIKGGLGRFPEIMALLLEHDVVVHVLSRRTGRQLHSIDFFLRPALKTPPAITLKDPRIMEFGVEHLRKPAEPIDWDNFDVEKHDREKIARQLLHEVTEAEFKAKAINEACNRAVQFNPKMIRQFVLSHKVDKQKATQTQPATQAYKEPIYIVDCRLEGEATVEPELHVPYFEDLIDNSYFEPAYLKLATENYAKSTHEYVQERIDELKQYEDPKSGIFGNRATALEANWGRSRLDERQEKMKSVANMFHSFRYMHILIHWYLDPHSAVSSDSDTKFFKQNWDRVKKKKAGFYDLHPSFYRMFRRRLVHKEEYVRKALWTSLTETIDENCKLLDSHMDQWYDMVYEERPELSKKWDEFVVTHPEINADEIDSWKFDFTWRGLQLDPVDNFISEPELVEKVVVDDNGTESTVMVEDDFLPVTSLADVANKFYRESHYVDNTRCTTFVGEFEDFLRNPVMSWGKLIMRWRNTVHKYIDTIVYTYLLNKHTMSNDPSEAEFNSWQEKTYLAAVSFPYPPLVMPIGTPDNVHAPSAIKRASDRYGFAAKGCRGGCKGNHTARLLVTIINVGDIGTAKLLLEHGVNPNGFVCDGSRESRIEAPAMKIPYYETMAYKKASLAEQGKMRHEAELKGEGERNRDMTYKFSQVTPLDAAMQTAQVEIIDELLKRKPNPLLGDNGAIRSGVFSSDTNRMDQVPNMDYQESFAAIVTYVRDLRKEWLKKRVNRRVDKSYCTRQIMLECVYQREWKLLRHSCNPHSKTRFGPQDTMLVVGLIDDLISAAFKPNAPSHYQAIEGVIWITREFRFSLDSERTLAFANLIAIATSKNYGGSINAVVAALNSPQFLSSLGFSVENQDDCMEVKKKFDKQVSTIKGDPRRKSSKFGTLNTKLYRTKEMAPAMKRYSHRFLMRKYLVRIATMAAMRSAWPIVSAILKLQTTMLRWRAADVDLMLSCAKDEQRLDMLQAIYDKFKDCEKKTSRVDPVTNVQLHQSLVTCLCSLLIRESTVRMRWLNSSGVVEKTNALYKRLNKNSPKNYSQTVEKLQTILMDLNVAPYIDSVITLKVDDEVKEVKIRDQVKLTLAHGLTQRVEDDVHHASQDSAFDVVFKRFLKEMSPEEIVEIGQEMVYILESYNSMCAKRVQIYFQERQARAPESWNFEFMKKVVEGCYNASMHCNQGPCWEIIKILKRDMVRNEEEEAWVQKTTSASPLM